MEFNGEMTLEKLPPRDAWKVLTDPVVLKRAIPGCEYLVRVEDENVDFEQLNPRDDTSDEPVFPEVDEETLRQRSFGEGDTYASRVSVGVGPIQQTFQGILTIQRASFPEIRARGRGKSSGSSVEATTGMTLGETDGGSRVEWWAETKVSGKIAQMGQRLLKPVSQKLVGQFFNRVEQQVKS